MKRQFVDHPTNGETAGATSPADRQPLSVIAVTPSNQALNVDMTSSIVLAFSAPLDPSSITSHSFPSLPRRDVALDPVIRYSADFRLVMLYKLPFRRTHLFGVTASDQVLDLWGRPLLGFQCEFHTAEAGARTPLVVAQYPPPGASGISSGNTIRLSLARAVEWNSARMGLRIIQDDEPVEGAIRLLRGSERSSSFCPISPPPARAQ